MKTVCLLGRNPKIIKDCYWKSYKSLAFHIRKEKLARVIGARYLVVDEDQIFIPTDGGLVHALPKNTIFFLEDETPFELILMDHGYTACSYALSKNIAKDKIMLKYFLQERNISTPDFKVNTGLEFPFLLKDKENCYLITELEEFKKPELDGSFISERYIKKLVQGTFRVLIFLNNIIGISYRFYKKINAFPESKEEFTEIPLIVGYNIKGISIRRVKKENEGTSYSRDIEYWTVLKPDEVEVLKEALVLDNVELEGNMVSGINKEVQTLAIKTMLALKLGFGIVDIITSTSGEPYVLGIDPDPHKEKIRKMFGVEDFDEWIISKLRKNSYF